MKRFYCTVCKRVKRVRVLPHNFDIIPGDISVGECRWHLAVEVGKSHRAWKRHLEGPRRPKRVVTTKKSSPSPAKSPKKSRKSDPIPSYSAVE